MRIRSRELAGAVLAALGAAAVVGSLWTTWYRVARVPFLGPPEVDGWEALSSADVALCALAVAALASAALGGRHEAVVLRLLAGLGSGAVAVARLVDLPPIPPREGVTPVPQAFVEATERGAGPWIALAGAALIVAGAVLGALAAPEERRRWASLPHRVRKGIGSLRADPERRAAVRESWRALWTSRALVWTAGIVGVLRFGYGPDIGIDPKAYNFGWFGDLLISPGAAWDGAHYLQIADEGYVRPDNAAFFPLYPLLVRAVGWVSGPTAVAGIAVSLGSFAVALYLLHRLVTLEVGRRYARAAVLVVACFPTALFFSAIYTESLFLALSVGCLYAARTGRWGWAGALGALAAGTRNSGVLLMVPLLVLHLYGPRPDGRLLERARTGRLAALLPRYRPGLGLAWIACVPLGLVAFLTYMNGRGDAFAPLRTQRVFWGRDAEPFGGVVDGLTTAWRAARQLVEGPTSNVLPTPPPALGGQLSDPFVLAQVTLAELAFLVFAAIALVGVFRRLPFAYGAYAATALALAVSAPTRYEPLVSLPRFVLVIFPLQVWLAMWAVDRRKLNLVLGGSAALLALFSAIFASYRWLA